MLRLADIQGKRRKLPVADGADALAWQLKAAGITGFECEFVFHPSRKWRLDIAFAAQHLAIEVEGFASAGASGRHSRAQGFNADCEKYAELAIAGWRVLRVTSKHVNNGLALQWIERALR